MQIAGSCAAAGATAAHAATAAADHLVQLAPEALAELRGMVESREDCSRSVQLALEQEACTVGGVMRQGMHGLLQVLETCEDAVCIDAAHAKGGCASGLQLGAGPHGTLLLHHSILWVSQMMPRYVSSVSQAYAQSQQVTQKGSPLG